MSRFFNITTVSLSLQITGKLINLSTRQPTNKALLITRMTRIL